MAAGVARFPETLAAALDCLERDDALLSVLGEPLAASYLAVRRSEWEAYEHADDIERVAWPFDKY